MSFIIAGIHTGIGKTICSTILTEALQYDYWKPVQAGDLTSTDSMFVRRHISNTKSMVHPESYKLQLAASPHYAAEKENMEIVPEQMTLPLSSNNIIVETAGGVLSPLSNTRSNLDLMKHLQLPVLLVSNDYLGSINHTILTIELLKHHNIETRGIVFCGTEVKSSREYILSRSKLPLLFSIPFFEHITQETIAHFAGQITADAINRIV